MRQELQCGPGQVRRRRGVVATPAGGGGVHSRPAPHHDCDDSRKGAMWPAARGRPPESLRRERRPSRRTRAGGQAQGSLGCDRPPHPNLIGADRIVAENSSVRVRTEGAFDDHHSCCRQWLRGDRQAHGRCGPIHAGHWSQSVSPESHATTGHPFVDLPPGPICSDWATT